MNKRNTGLLDSAGKEIMEGDWVSLDHNMTADDSMGWLPNGWTFHETDVYEVYWDSSIQNWTLRMGVEPDTPYNCKYLNHATSVLHNGDALIVPKPNTDV